MATFCHQELDRLCYRTRPEAFVAVEVFEFDHIGNMGRDGGLGYWLREEWWRERRKKENRRNCGKVYQQKA